ncbi:MAG: carboxypeptidase M32 [Firmicutes bacterium]|nr:carboxypeptidase M32 [Bacillota bacterium]
MNRTERLNEFNKWKERLAAYRLAMNVLEIDLIAGAPKEGAYYRASKTAVLMGEYLNTLRDEKMYEIITDLLREERLNGMVRRELELYHEELTKDRSVPIDLYVYFEEILTRSKVEWLRAKAEDDFKGYASCLKDVIDCYRGMISLKDSPLGIYDRMLDNHQKGWTSYKYDEFFGHVRERIIPLMEEILTSGKPSKDIFKGDYSIDGQRRVMAKVCDMIGFDSSWGRMTESEHPVTSFISIGDVRFTTKYIPDDPVRAILSTVHESGHAWFGHNVDKAYEGSIIATSISAGLHESQSRLCENHLGRSLAFWEVVFPWLRDEYPHKFSGVTLPEFYRTVNAVRPSLIRTEADEVTYPLHILIRYELERDLMEGDLKVADLETAWNDKYRDYLGLVPEKASEGVLQDMHWPYAYFGYFPTYALGSAMAAQFFAVMCVENDVDGLIRDGRYTELMKWLGKKYQHYGNRYSAEDVLMGATSEAFNDEYYFKWLENKYRLLYGLL